LSLVELVEEDSKIVKDTFSIRSLHNNTKEIFWVMVFKEISIISSHHFNPQEASFGLDNLNRWNEHVIVKEYFFALALMHIVAHEESFGTGTSLIQKRGIADLKLSELLDHGLIVDKRL